MRTLDLKYSAKMKSMKVDAVNQLRNRVLKNFRQYGAYLWHDTKNGSVYIKFKDSRIGSIRISNHYNQGRKKYKYKWNLLAMSSTPYPRWKKFEPHVRYYYTFRDYENFREHLKNYIEKING